MQRPRRAHHHPKSFLALRTHGPALCAPHAATHNPAFPAAQCPAFTTADSSAQQSAITAAHVSAQPTAHQAAHKPAKLPTKLPAQHAAHKTALVASDKYSFSPGDCFVSAIDDVSFWRADELAGLARDRLLPKAI